MKTLTLRIVRKGTQNINLFGSNDRQGKKAKTEEISKNQIIFRSQMRQINRKP